MGGMGDMGIVPRLQDYFRRQSQWLDQLKNDLERVADELQSEEPDDLLEKTRRWDVRNQAFAEEYLVLRKEWDASDQIATRDRDAIRAVARDVELQVEAVRQLYLQSAALAGETSASLNERLGELNLGRDMLGKYRIPSAPDSGSFDSSM
jgi:hypothetical protein